MRFASVTVLEFASAALFPPHSFADFGVERIATGLSSPVYVTAPQGDSDRLFITELSSGDIKILDMTSNTVLSTPYVTISPPLGEGPLSQVFTLAFHPDFANNRQFYVNSILTDRSGMLFEYTAGSTAANTVDPTSQQLVWKFAKGSGHRAGWIGFSPNDQFLYVTSGDGGGTDDNDPGHSPGTGNAQDVTGKLLGKMHRINVNADDFSLDDDRNYGIPADNPFDSVSGDEEIWAYGLRNPWRASFDRENGDFYIADVGEDTREEVNFQHANAARGANYGWRLREGTIKTPTNATDPPGEEPGGSPPPDNVEPVYDYTHGPGPFEGQSVTGGYVYRGPIAALQGKYFFGDFVSNRIWSIEVDRDTETVLPLSLTDWTDVLVPDVGSVDQLVSLGEDGVGNLYVVDLDGDIFRVTGLVVPEPNAALMMLLGFGLLGAMRPVWRSHRSRESS